MGSNSSAIPAWERLLTILVIFLPLVGFIVGIIPLWGLGADVTSLLLCALLYFGTQLGVTVGFHRYFTHRGFEITKRPLKWALGVLGSMAWEGSLYAWVTWHLKHHSSPDKPGDPHSPHLHGAGLWGFLKGFFHAHMGWMLITPAQKNRAAKLFRNDNDVELIDRWFLAFAVGGLVLPVVMGIALRRSIEWVHVDFVWGGLIRVFLMHHVTWSVNSVCHIWGTRPFQTGDQSTNNRVVGFVAMGEGWHNNHHQFPNSAKHGLLPGQWDFAWLVIRFLEKWGWITTVKVPSEAEIQKRLNEAHA